MMNLKLDLLQPYPFEKLAHLKAQVEANSALSHIALSIGEPKHTPPQFVLETMKDNLAKVSNYPATKGLDELRNCIASWATRRFHLNSIDPGKHILPVSGTREAIFAFTQAAVDAKPSAKVLMPNPFYQIYEGAALLAGAEPVFLNCEEKNNFLPDFDNINEATWHDCQVLFLCSPGNPTGSVLDTARLQKLIHLADKYDFIIASDECYSELYFDETSPPVGLLQACAEMGRDDYARCVVFHSLSKRSNLPGLRSGFIAGDADIMQAFLLYRTYHGCALPLHTQMASIAAWSDEQHVIENRNLYREKFKKVLSILNDGASENENKGFNVSMPEAGFYLWANTPINDELFAQKLFTEQHITVLPGSYLARDTQDGNPGENRVRMALVASLDECIDAAKRIKVFCESLS